MSEPLKPFKPNMRIIWPAMILAAIAQALLPMKDKNPNYQIVIYILIAIISILFFFLIFSLIKRIKLEKVYFNNPDLTFSIPEGNRKKIPYNDNLWGELINWIKSTGAIETKFSTDAKKIFKKTSTFSVTRIIVLEKSQPNILLSHWYLLPGKANLEKIVPSLITFLFNKNISKILEKHSIK